ncbi:TetR/AcrR family transcriptional regulator [Nocardiopsis sp. NRRL B-16309]|uniref:TetR/AcrR family transcriptional regulator n=1 Tax=Nocardiopsis sp. NRRL B-16309 TaxID=1519494 RepID=UPI0006AE7FA4|nr:TetR family transcriptional regulator [Nocardiopsis sp. NRRL B-16309]KOX17354.1 TetR family transcriptional regulator [Nocardiopsis sp. NRRL B-16309]
MPETERRAQILDAVERLLGRGGLEAVTMREVAAEAGVSLRLVQYYGRSKDELLTAALERLADKSVRRWHARSEEHARNGRPEDGSALPRVRAFLDEALPTDEASRSFHRVGVSLELLTITRPGAAAEAYRAHLGALADHLAGILRTDPRIGAADAHRLASETMALAHGVGSLLMAGQMTQSAAEALLDGYVDRLAARLST